jgi:uncharacterized membrane protein HdeD (DUF308 family)
MDHDIVFIRGIAVRWWVVALRGAAAILFGILAFLAPGLTLVVLTVWLAAFMAVDGALAVISGISALRHHKHGAALLAEGALGLLIALLVLVWPIAGIATVVYLVAAWAALTGAALLWAAAALPMRSGRLLMAAAAGLSVVLAILLFAHPVAGAVVLAWWLGAYALVSGVLMLGLAFSLRQAVPRGGVPA